MAKNLEMIGFELLEEQHISARKGVHEGDLALITCGSCDIWGKTYSSFGGLSYFILTNGMSRHKPHMQTLSIPLASINWTEFNNPKMIQH